MEFLYYGTDMAQIRDISKQFTTEALKKIYYFIASPVRAKLSSQTEVFNTLVTNLPT